MKNLIIILFLFSSVIKAEEFEEFKSSSVVVGNKVLPYYIVYDKEKIPVGFFVESKDWTDKDIKGYGGNIDLQIYFSFDGKIKDIKVIEQYETELYAKDVFSKKFLSQYYGKNNKAKFILGEDIKAITGATISCSAVNEIIYQCVKNVNLYLVKKDVVKKYSLVSKFEKIKVGILTLLFILSILGFIQNSKPLRYIIMSVAILFLGIIYKGGLSFGHIKNFIYLNLPSSSNIFIWSFILLIIISSLLFGRLYCGWLCPFGAVIEFLFNIKKFFEIKYKKSLGKKIEIELVEDNVFIKFLRKYEYLYRYIKYIFAVLILLYPKLIFFEPFQHMFLINKTSLKGIIYLIIILIFCILFMRLWCRYFCPLGGFLSLFSKISLFRLKICTEKCFNCEICKTICLTNAIVEKNNKPRILYTECILCNKCRQFCGPKNINISFLK